MFHFVFHVQYFHLKARFTTIRQNLNFVDFSNHLRGEQLNDSNIVVVWPQFFTPSNILKIWEHILILVNKEVSVMVKKQVLK